MFLTEDQIELMVKNQKEVLDLLINARKEEMQTFLLHQEANDKLSNYTRNKVIEITSNPEFSNVDPRSGEPSQEWARWLIDRYLEGDEGFVMAMAEVHETQEAYLEAKTNVQNYKDELISINIRLEMFGRVHGQVVEKG